MDNKQKKSISVEDFPFTSFRPFSKWLIITFFVIFLLIPPAFILITPDKAWSENENRYLQKAPDISLRAIVTTRFMNEFENYCQDQFPGRNNWVGLKTLTERLLLKQDAKGVYFGKDNYFLEEFKKPDFKIVKRNIDAINSFSKDFTGKCYMLTAPSSIEVLKEKLPPFAVTSSQKEISDLISDTLSETINYVDVTDELYRNKNSYIFFRTDHHWTAKGAYFAYKELCGIMGIAPLDSSFFDINTEAEDFVGTLQSKLNITAPQGDIIESYSIKPDFGFKFEVRTNNSEEWHDGIFYYNNLEKKDKYTFYLDGNHAVVHIRKVSSGTSLISSVELPGKYLPEGRKLLVFKDSFAHIFMPFIACHFDEIHMIDMRYFNFNVNDYITEHSIDTVLFLYSIPDFCTDATIARVAP